MTYAPDFFAPYAPQTALDMVRRVPGFSISEGEERRGLSGAAGNVLIDGAAPVVKSLDIEEILERIPAQDVVRIDLIRGDGASASSGQAVRVNVVRRPSNGEGVWEASLERAEDGRFSPAAQAAWSGRRGSVEYALSALLEDTHAPIHGDVRSFDVADALDERERERIAETETERRLSGEITAPFGGGSIALNASVSSEVNRERQAVSTYDSAGAPDGSEDVHAEEREDIAEMSVTYTRVLGPWEGEFAALATRGRLVNEERAEDRTAAGAFDEAEAEDRDVFTGETVVRASAVRTFRGGARLSLAAEGALNTLDQTLALTEDDGSGPVPVTPPGANVSIEEMRAELSATLSWRPAPRWTVELGAAAEASNLEQSGDVSESTALVYWKPSLQALRAIGEDDQLRVRIYRDVGQLNFEDFAASAELESSTIYAGNADLRPETSWRLELAGDWRFEHGALQLTAFYWAIEDALDFVPVGPPGDQLDARGNIGDATLYGLRAVFEAPAPFLRDASLRGEGLWQQSDATDPLTGEARAQSEIVESSISLEFRHDIEALDLAWGVSFERERIAPEFRLDLVSDDQDADGAEIWVETTRVSGVKLRLYAESPFDAHETRSRTRFDPDRNGLFDGTEERVRAHGPIFGVSLQGAF